MYQVFINGEEIDLYEDTVIPITYQVYRIDDLSSVLSNYTKTIRVPHTDKNDKVFGFASLVEVNDSLSKDYFVCKVFKHGIEIITSGKGRLMFYSDDGFELQIMFGNYNLLNDVANKKLTELITTDIDHIWNSQNIEESSFINNSFTKNYIYPLIQWNDDIFNSALVNGDIIDSNDINIEMLLPVIKARYIFDKIISEAGYTLNPDSETSLALIEDMYISLVNIKGNATTLFQMSQASFMEANAFIQVDKIVIDGQHLFPVDLGTTPFTINYFDQMKRIAYDNVSHVEHFFSAYRMGVNGTVGVHASVNFLIEQPGILLWPDSKLQICVCPGLFLDHVYDEHGVEIDHVFDYIVMAEVPVADTGEYIEVGGILYREYYGGLSYIGEFAPSDFIFMLVDYVWDYAGPGTEMYIYQGSLECDRIIANEYDADENVVETTGFGYHLPIGINLPDVTQADFLKSLFAKRNLVITTNQFDKLITIKKFDDIFLNLPIAKDWSSKINLKPQPQTDYSLDGFYKRNWYRYEQLALNSNNDNSNKELASGYFDINNKFLESNDPYFKSLFSETETVIATMHSLVVPLIKFINYIYTVTPIVPRILILKQETVPVYPSSASIPLSYTSILDGYTYDEVTGNTRARAFFIASADTLFSSFVGNDDLHFQNILNNHYPKLINMLQNYKKLIAEIDLDEMDVVNFDHFFPIWLDVYHSYFYVNQILDYIDGLTQVELIKLY